MSWFDGIDLTILGQVIILDRLNFVFRAEPTRFPPSLRRYAAEGSGIIGSTLTHSRAHIGTGVDLGRLALFATLGRICAWARRGPVPVIALLFGATACQFINPPRQAVMIGTAPLESSALIYVAEAQGFFAQNGLNVTLKNYETGAAALNGLVTGEVDVAVPAEYALVGKAFTHDPLSAIASIDKAEYFDLIARRDRGIQTIDDLRGKTIGVTRKTIAEFYLGRFLELHGIAPDNVTLVDVSVAQSESAIGEGQVDAIMARPPTSDPIQERLGANAMVWRAQGSQPLFALLIARNIWIKDHADLVRQLCRALMQAEQYLILHPVEAKAVVQKRLNLAEADMDEIWTQNQFSLTLEESLIVAMADEARWMIKNNLTSEKTVPDFLEYVNSNGLKAVKPDAVNVIH